MLARLVPKGLANAHHRLSITKWIHLNQGDDGLVTFFRKIHRVLHDGGHLVLEPQAWESYAKAKRMAEVCILLFDSVPSHLVLST